MRKLWPCSPPLPLSLSYYVYYTLICFRPASSCCHIKQLWPFPLASRCPFSFSLVHSVVQAPIEIFLFISFYVYFADTHTHVEHAQYCPHTFGNFLASSLVCFGSVLVWFHAAQLLLVWAMPQFDTDVPNVEILFHCPFEGESVAQKVPDKTKEIIMKQVRETILSATNYKCSCCEWGKKKKRQRTYWTCMVTCL